MIAQAQQTSIDCSFSLTPEQYKAKVQEVPAINANAANASPPTNMEDIPVRFTIFRDDDGDYSPSSANIDQADIDFAIQKLNTFYADLGFNFIQCGEPLYVNNSNLYDEFSSTFYEEYSYVSSAANVYIRHSTHPSNASTPDNDPTVVDNTLVFNFQQFRSSSGVVVTHEMGHHFNLLHITGAVGVYNVPPLDYPPGVPAQQDHPYLGEDGKRRELVIIEPLPSNDPRVFKEPNCGISGDFVCDTPPGCVIGESYAIFYPNPDDPDCYPTVNSQTCISSGCTFENGVYTGNYRDYNGDVISFPTDNFMRASGGVEITQGQKNRVMMAYETWREVEYEPTLCGNLQDKVEFEGTTKGLDRVHIKFNHLPNEERYCNTLTSPDNGEDGSSGSTVGLPFGTFNGKFYANTVHATVTKLGKGPNMEYIYDSNGDGINDKNEWLDGVSTLDLVNIRKHILNTSLLENGYKKLAADVNNSGAVSTFDIVLLRKLILGINETLAGFTQPWRFIPEYIPQDHQVAFDDNPFDIDVLGDEGLSSRYTTADAIIPSTDGNNDKSGFDAVKIGDVTGDALDGICEENMDVVWASSSFSNPNAPIPVNNGELVTVLVTGIAANNVVGLQVGLDFSNDDFKLDGFEGVGILAQTEATHFNTTTKGKTHNIKTSWIDDTMNGVNFAFGGMPGGGSVGQQLFKVRLIAQQYIPDLRASLHLINDKLFIPNFYDTNGCLSATSLELKKVANSSNLEANTGNYSSFSERLRCYPNPFTHQVKVVLDVEEKTDGMLIIQDPFGKILLQRSSHFHTGRNIITLDDFKDYPSGVFIVSVQTDEQIYSIKMLKN